DSLKKYNARLRHANIGADKLHTFQNRTTYYLLMLRHQYDDAIRFIDAMRRDTLYSYEDIDKQNLADAYYNAGLNDSAKFIVNGLLADKSQIIHPEIVSHLYHMLGDIAMKAGDYNLAAADFKTAL